MHTLLAATPAHIHLTFFRSIVIGLMQGVTELFPLSSLGHSVLLPALLGWHDLVKGESGESGFLAYLVGLHVATALALLAFFWRDWVRILKGGWASVVTRKVENSDQRLFWLLVIVTIPVGVIGLAFEHRLRTVFAKPALAATFLFVNGLILYAGERLRTRVATKKLESLAYPEGFFIGLFQSLALLAGISRSGVTMVGGLVRGLDHEDAAKFAFLAATPAILGAGVVKFSDLTGPLADGIRGQIVAGSAVAAVAAWLSVRYLVKYFETRTLTPFAVYCVIVGGVLALGFGTGLFAVVTSALVRVTLPDGDNEASEVIDGIVVQLRGRRVVLDSDRPVDRDDVLVIPPLQILNSMSRRLERLVTLEPGRVTMYSCGPTVYSYQHLGNLRAYVFADTVKRGLRWRGYDVRHVINITDVGHLIADGDEGEDKVEDASRREGRSVEEITGHYTEQFWKDLHAVNVTFPEEWPKASTYVSSMINFAIRLQELGYAYVIPEGLYFDTARQADYGALAGIDFAAQQATGRVESAEGKRAPADFALWRTFTDGRERLMQWESPWGVGAPGWHLECSVMSMALLGDHFDLHTGGVDHRELHHVNEIAQSEAYLGDGLPWVRYWMHGEFLTFKDAKMSKSAGGTLLLSDLIARGVHPQAYRYLLLQSHYTSQVSFSDNVASAAHVGLKRLAARVAGLGGAPLTLVGALDAARSDLARARVLELDAAVAADLMTPTVLSLLQTWTRDMSVLSPEDWAVVLGAVNAVTGLTLGSLSAADFEPALPDGVDRSRVADLVEQREAARVEKDWPRSDALRASLSEAGIQVDDTPSGPHWYYVGAS